MTVRNSQPASTQELDLAYLRLRGSFDFHNHIDTISQAARKKGVSRVTRYVAAHTGGVNEVKPLYDQQSNGVLTNQETATQTYFQLPPATPGVKYTFAVMDTDGLRVVAHDNNFIRFTTTLSNAGGSIRSTGVGNVITLMAVSNTLWVNTHGIGTWTITT